jgi:hypothetical protein
MRWAVHVVSIGEIRDHLNALGVDGGEKLEQIFEIRWEVVNWIHLAQYRDQWQVLLNTVMNLRIP